MCMYECMFQIPDSFADYTEIGRGISSWRQSLSLSGPTNLRSAYVHSDSLDNPQATCPASTMAVRYTYIPPNTPLHIS